MVYLPEADTPTDDGWDARTNPSNPPGNTPNTPPADTGWDRQGQYAEDDAACKSEHGDGWEAVPRHSPDDPRQCRQIGAQSGSGGFDPGGFNYRTPSFTGAKRPQYDIPPAPEFNPPSFNAPDPEGIYRDPSFQFRKEQGLGALEASAAAKGVLRTGGTLQDIVGYAQQFASQEYQAIFNRALAVYDREYQAAAAKYAPKFSEWQTLAGAEIGAGNLAFQAALDLYYFGINDEFRRQQMIFEAGAP